MILLSKAFQRLLNYSFDTIFRNFNFSAAEVSEGDFNQTMCSFVVSKVQNGQGILLFVHWIL